MPYYFTSDTHFNSEEIIIRENRPFVTSKDQDDYIINKFNENIKNHKKENDIDYIYFIGDFVNYNNNDKVSWKQALTYVQKINANVILIIGNGEQRIIDNEFNSDFESFRKYCISIGFYDVKKEEYLTMRNTNFYLNHYPKNHKNYNDFVNLFGHTHRATGLWKPYGLNVGCDLNHFYLLSEDDIFNLIEQKEKYWDTDPDNLCM